MPPLPLTFFKPKQGPVLTQGRFQHLLVGEHICLLGAAIAGYQGLAFSIGAMMAFAFAWELATPWISRTTRWPHPWGDVIDLLAYVLGGILGSVLGLAVMR